VNFVSQIRKESKTFPGVFYTLNKMSEARRANLRLRIAEPTSKIRNLLREMGKIEESYPPTQENRPEAVMDDLMKLADQMEELSASKINPEWLKWGCKKIEGLEIDGVEATPELLITDGPPILFAEIVDEIKRLAQLNGDEEKNSASPTTSGAVTDGTSSDSSAATASSTASSEVPTEIVENISQS
jgi:hypothetical protein